MQATLRIIARSGMNSLTTSALAAEAGISEANLYRHFRSKDEILAATIGQVRDMVSVNLARVQEGTVEPADVLKKFFASHVKMMEQNAGITRLMFSEELHVHQHLRENILKTMYAVSGRMASLIHKGQKTGALRRDIDARTTVMMFMAMIQGLAFRWSLTGFSFSLAKEATKTWKNFEKLICLERRTARRSA